VSATPVHVALLGPANSVHLQRWATALHERGRRVTVLTQHAHGALPLPAGVDLVALPASGMAGYFLNAWAVRRWLRRCRPDLLHAHYASGYGTTAMLAAWHPTLLSVWGSDVYEFPFQARWKGWLLRRNLRAADALASTSQAMARQVRRLVPETADVAITPFGVDTDRFRPEPAVPRPVVIGTVKSLAPVYGIDLLLEAFARLRSRPAGADCRLLIVGDGPQRSELEAQARRLGLVDTVRWIGAVPHAEVPAWLHQLDIYVAPSRAESFGVAVAEAMACGVAVVVSDAGGLPEVVDAGRSGLVVPAGDVGALADALEGLVLDPPLRARLAAQARVDATQRHAWPVCVDRMIECQDAVIRQHRALRT
jgi:L-malate glycosyltransferase